MAEATTFAGWAKRWMKHATFDGPTLTDARTRIDAVSALWGEAIPGEWKRHDVDRRLLKKDPDNPGRCLSYQRSHAGERRGEHQLEYDVLCRPRCMRVLGHPLIDGVNAVPLVRAPKGSGRLGNVEPDMLLLAGAAQKPRHQFLVEVKVKQNNAWYAAVELARQMRLFRESPVSQQIFAARNPTLKLRRPPPATGLVLAPPTFYSGDSGKGQKPNSVQPALDLCERLRTDHHIVLLLAVWNPGTGEITQLATP